MLDTIRNWVAIQPEEDMLTRMAEIEKEIDSTYFAWIGDYGPNKKCYFRIQGSSFITELLSISTNIGQLAAGQGHYHTVYRNFNKDYGVTKK